MLHKPSAVGVLERYRAEDREATRIVAYRVERQLRRVRVPGWRMNDGGIDAAFIHQPDRLRCGERRDLPVREVARQAAAPKVDLGVNDAHRASRAGTTYTPACDTNLVLR